MRTESAHRASPFGRLALVAGGFACALVVLLLLEVAVRLTTDPRQRENAARFARESLTRLAPCAVLETRDGANWLVANPSATERPFALPLERRQGVTRIALVGESSGGMFGYELAALLQANPAMAKQFELIDCAVAGSSLEHVERRADEVLAYRPDALVVVFGHNLDMHYPMDAARLEALTHAYRSAFVTTAADLLRTPIGPASGSFSERLDAFERWLDGLATRARRDGVGLVVTTVASNHLVPPDAPVASLADPDFVAARLAYARGDEEDAIERLAALAERTADAYRYYELGLWQSRLGRDREAVASLRKGVDLPQSPRDRAPTSVNAAIRRLAEREGVWCFDSERITTEASALGVPGWDTMRDHCHLLPSLFRQQTPLLLETALAAAGMSENERPHPAALVVRDVHPLAQVLDGATAAEAARPNDRAPRWLETIARAIEHWAREDLAQTDRVVDQYLNGPRFAAVADANRRGRILAALADGYWSAGRRDRAIALNGRGREQPSAQPWVQLALFELEAGDRQKARHALDEAARIDPNRADLVPLRDGITP